MRWERVKCCGPRANQTHVLGISERSPKRERRPRSCGFRRSGASSANRIRLTWRYRVASYRLRRSSAKLGKLARRRKHRANSIVGLLDLIALGHMVRTKSLADTSELW